MNKNVFSILELFATEENIGITKTSSQASCESQACETSTGKCFNGAEMIKIPDSFQTNTFVGSIFWLSGEEFEVIVVCGSDVEKGTISLRKWSYPDNFDKVYYISPTGSGDSCTNEEPCLPNTVLPSKIKQGSDNGYSQKVVFKEGVYKERISNSLEDVGGENKKILFIGEEGKNAIIDGSKDITNKVSLVSSPGEYSYQWENDETDTWQVLLVNKLDSTDIIRLLIYHDKTDLDSLKYVNPGYYKTNSHIFFNLGDSYSLNNYYLFISTMPRFLQLSNVNHLYIHNLFFQYIQSSQYSNAFYFHSNCKFIWFNKCSFSFAKIGAKYGSKYFLFENNYFRDSKFGLSWTGVKGQTGGQSSGDESGPISNFGGNSGDATLRGTTFRNNEVYNFFDGLSAGHGSTTPFLTTENDYYGNYIHACGDDAIEADATSVPVSNLRIYGNKIENILVPISLAPAESGPIWIINNIFKSIGKAFQTHTSYNGLTVKYNYQNYHSTGKNYIYHNLIISDDSESSAFRITPTNAGNDIVLRNNILIGDSFVFEIGFDESTTFYDFDYDAMYCRTENEFSWWTGISSRHIRTLDSFQSQMNQENNGILLENENIFKNLDYELLDDAIIKGKGQYIRGINSENPDIGLLSTFINPSVPKIVPFNYLALVLGISIPLFCGIFVFFIIGIVLIIALSIKWKK